MTREEALKQFMMNQMSDRGEDLGFYLLGEIYDDFESHTCENCKYLIINNQIPICDIYNYFLTEESIKILKCDRWETKFVSTDTKSQTNKGEEDE